MPLGSLQEPAKSLPRAVPEPSRSPSQPSEASCQAPKRTPRACFADLSTFFDRSRDRYINFCGHLCFIDALHHGVIICPLPFFVATTFEHLLLPDIVSAFQHGLPLLFLLSCSATILLHTFSKKRDVLVSGIAMIEIRFYSA